MIPVEERGLPEHYHYRDTGCNVSPSCLSCPLPRCKYDDPAEYHRVQYEQRFRQILQVQRSGNQSAAMLARQFGLSVRTMQRALSRLKEASGA